MKYTRHAFAVGMDRIDDRLFLRLQVSGKLTHADYETFVPMLEAAIREAPDMEIRALVDLRELEGIEARAAWDDLKLGLRHGRRFDRIALVGSHTLEKIAVRIAGWFTGGESRRFDDPDAALDWLFE